MKQAILHFLLEFLERLSVKFNGQIAQVDTYGVWKAHSMYLAMHWFSLLQNNLLHPAMTLPPVLLVRALVLRLALVPALLRVLRLARLPAPLLVPHLVLVPARVPVLVPHPVPARVHPVVQVRCERLISNLEVMNREQHWETYLKALGSAKTPISNTSQQPVVPYLTSSSGTEYTGFQYLKPAQPEVQARYDAMQGSWEGVSASDAAIAKGVFSTESMPIVQKAPYSK